jgi:hypothetical protein
VHVGYQVREPRRGATEARLQALVRAFEAVAYRQDLVRIPPGGVLQSVTIEPQSVVLSTAGIVQLRLVGTMSTGRRAPRADLARADWRSNDAGVADVDFRGQVTGLKAGVTTVTASVGPITATVTITVTAPGGGQPVIEPQRSRPAPASSSPGSPSPSSASPTPSGSASPTDTPTPPPSPSDSGTPGAGQPSGQRR